MQDPALLHVTLLLSAWSLVNLQGRSPTPLVMYHKAESIRWLNESLLNSNHAAKDSTIAAVASLTAVEVFVQRHLHFFYMTNLWPEYNGKRTWRENPHGWFRGPGKRQRWHTGSAGTWLREESSNMVCKEYIVAI